MSIAYAAGLYEGEGTVFHSGRVRQATIKMTDVEPLVRFWEATGLGNITGPYEREGCKPIFSWQAGAREDLHQLREMLWPYLSPRRQAQFDRVLTT